MFAKITFTRKKIPINIICFFLFLQRVLFSSAAKKSICVVSRGNYGKVYKV